MDDFRLTEEEKARIRLEELYRHDICKQIDQSIGKKNYGLF